MSITAIDDVCTDAHLEDVVGGKKNLRTITPADWQNAQPKRQDVLDRVLKSLLNRTPPIRETELVDVAELQQVVAYGTLADLYIESVVEKGDRFEVKAAHYLRLYNTELASLRPTIVGPQTAGPMSITIHRR